ncbi:hypothetical protein GCM10007301_31280 [Azorhizobium oxalatiphilum]|uniref:Uncharacterized protein n=1 Tax=Azorhizobium oxalatiphilum TaxID=980631 RepID=A0A917C497_9HYPH|nr:hypothetical protein GCM10007301_31280 [Azorhizobium oxalatiphilum]
MAGAQAPPVMPPLISEGRPGSRDALPAPRDALPLPLAGEGWEGEEAERLPGVHPSPLVMAGLDPAIHVPPPGGRMDAKANGEETDF